MTTILVSAIISTYNSESFIRGRIENLLHQTISDQLEIIIVNSGSEENEAEIIKEFLEKYHQITYIETEQRETVYKAWNRGIRIAKGKYITNTNTDDRLREDALEILAYTLDKNPDKALVYADQYITNVPNQNFDDVISKKTFSRIDYSRFKLYSGYIAGPQSMWRSSLHFKDNIWFNEELEVSGDYDFVCKVAEKYNFLRVRGILGVYYKADDNSNKEFRNYEETHKESFEVREKYLRRYLKSLSPDEINKIEKRIELYKIITHNFYRIISKLFSIFKPENQIPSREYVYLVASTLEEIRGNNIKAIEYCKTYVDKTEEGLIKRQYDRLLKASTERNKPE